MSNSLIHNIRAPQELIAKKTEELAGFVLEHLHILSVTIFSRRDVVMSIVNSYPAQYQGQIYEAVSEAFAWLELHRFIAPTGEPDRFFISRKGQPIKRASDLPKIQHDLETDNQQEPLYERNLKRLFLALLFSFIGIGVLFLPYVSKWKWLQEHPNRLGLYIAEIALVVCLSWAIVDKKRRAFALGVVVVGIFFVVIQIIGR